MRLFSHLPSPSPKPACLPNLFSLLLLAAPHTPGSSGLLALEPTPTCLAGSTLSPPGALACTCSAVVDLAEGGGGVKDLDPAPPGEGLQTACDRIR